MRRLCIFGAASLLLASGIQAKLVPKNFCDDPAVQRLTAAFTEEHWQTNAFGQCKGISVRPVDRKSNELVKFYLWAVADEVRDGVVYGVGSESSGVKEVQAARRFGARGQGNGQFCQPTGVAVDTTLYCTEPNYFYVYVADSRNGRVVRCRFNWDTRTLAYDGTIDLGLANPIDVDCVTEQGSQTALLAVLDADSCAVTVLRIRGDLSTEVLVTYGAEGSGEGQFCHPTGLCIRPRHDGSYDICVADQWNSRIVALVLSDDEQGQWEIQWLNQYRAEYGYPGFEDVAVSDPYGYVYVTARFANAIYVFRPGLAELVYVRSGGVEFPRNLSCLGDEMAMTESWTAQSGMQYFRIVPGIRITCNHSLFDATNDSLLFSVQLEEIDGYSDITIEEGGTVKRHLVTDSAMHVGAVYDFCWDGRCDDGKLALPGYYSMRVDASYRRDETDPDLIAVQKRTTRVKGARVSGSQSGIWNAPGGPYVLTGNVVVPLDLQLRVEPGVWVMPASDHKLTVEGKFVARGTPAEPVHITPYRKIAPVTDSAAPGD